jgi:hypothetical protein
MQRQFNAVRQYANDLHGFHPVSEVLILSDTAANRKARQAKNTKAILCAVMFHGWPGPPGRVPQAQDAAPLTLEVL